MERTQSEGEESASSGTVERRGQAAEGLQTALNLLEQERSAQQQAGDQASEAESLRKIGDLQRTSGKYDAARDAYTKARYLHQLLGDAPGAAAVLVLVGRMEIALKRWDAAARAFGQAADLHRRTLDTSAEADVLLSLGDAQVALAQTEAARESFLAAARAYSGLDDVLGQAHASFRLGTLLGAEDVDRADEYLEFAEAMYRHAADLKPSAGKSAVPGVVRDSRQLNPGVMVEVCARQRRTLRGEPEVTASEATGDNATTSAAEGEVGTPTTRPGIRYAGIAAIAFAALAFLLPRLIGDGSSSGLIEALRSLTFGFFVYLGVAAFGATAAIVAVRQQGVSSFPILLGVGIGFAAIFFEIGRAMFPTLAEKEAAPMVASVAGEVPESVRRAEREAPIFEDTAEKFRAKGDFKGARQAFAQALAGFETAHDIDAQVRVLLAQASMESENGETRSALDLSRRAFLLSRSGADGDTTEMKNLLKRIIELAQAVGDDERLRDAQVNLLSLMEKSGDLAGQAEQFAVLAELEKRRGEWDRAHEWYNRAHGAHQDLRNKRGQVEALMAMAELEQYLGRRRQAYGSYYHAFVLYREMDDASGQASMLLYLGALDELAERWPEASAAFRQSQRIYKALGDRPGEAKALFRFGTVQAAHGNARQARNAFDDSLGFFESTGDHASQAGVLRGLGRLEERDEHYDTARLRYQRALELYASAQGDVANLGALAVLLDLALLERKSGRDPEALQSYNSARDLVKTLPDQAQRARLLLGVADMGAKLGNADEASQMYNEAVAIFVELGDSSGDATARDRLAALATGRINAGS